MADKAVRHRGDTFGELFALKSVDDLDIAIKLVGMCDLHQEQIERNLDLAVAKLRDDAKADAEYTQQQRNNLLVMIQSYMEANKDELLKGRKAVSLNFGKAGWRRRPAVIPLPRRNTTEMEDLCDRLEGLQAEFGGAFKDVVIKSVRYIEQDVKQLTDDELGALELERRPAREEFFVQPDRQKLAEVING